MMERGIKKVMMIHASRSTFILLLLILLKSCSSPELDFERTALIVDRQQIEILTAHELYEYFLTSKPTYRKAIVEKIKTEFQKDSEFPGLLETIDAEIKPDEHLREEVEILKSIDIESIVNSTFQNLVKELPGPDTKVLFIPANPAYKEIYESYGIGIHAITVGEGKIIVSINPTIRNWEQLLPYTLAHEYHHSVWISRNFKTAELTPLEYLILEGRADAFAKRLYPETRHPFLKRLKSDQENTVWNLLKPELRKENSFMNDQLMSGADNIPTGSVYSIGFNIIESFKSNNPHISDLELIDMNPEQVLMLSKYEDVVKER
jgi:uncharacterized protein YjaZ